MRQLILPSTRFDAFQLSRAMACWSCGCAGFGRHVDDAAITTKVKAALIGAPDVSGTAISVETYRGNVQLSGFVDSAVKAQRAVELASRVEGVSEVTDKMSVKQN